ncbi:hypothetical protein D3C73_956900 [compost metagenome]
MSGCACVTSRMRAAAVMAEPMREAPRMIGPATSKMPMTASSSPASTGPSMPPVSCVPKPNHSNASTDTPEATCKNHCPLAATRAWLRRARALAAHKRSKCSAVCACACNATMSACPSTASKVAARNPAALSCAAAPGLRAARSNHRGTSTQAVNKASANASAAAGTHMPNTAVSTAPASTAVAKGASTNRNTVSKASTSPVMRATRSPLR